MEISEHWPSLVEGKKKPFYLNLFLSNNCVFFQKCLKLEKEIGFFKGESIGTRDIKMVYIHCQMTCVKTNSFKGNTNIDKIGIRVFRNKVGLKCVN